MKKYLNDSEWWYEYDYNCGYDWSVANYYLILHQSIISLYLADIYVHADLHGATSVIVKNPTGKGTN